MSDKGVIEHLLISGIGVLLGYSFGSLFSYPLTGAIISWAYFSGVFAGREHNQNEVRWCNTFNQGRRSGAPWNCGFRTITMDLHSVLGFVGPFFVGALLVAGLYFVER
jgi:hypothetical protein